jgi:NAD(P)-dependent dehydrogenase (short-subunit alcohol dehydrogenase family)
MDLGLNGHRVIISAAAGGIGLAVARAFVRAGARVSVRDVDGAALGALATSDPSLHSARCGVSRQAQVARWFEATRCALGGLDGLVNNAGSGGCWPQRRRRAACRSSRSNAPR